MDKKKVWGKVSNSKWRYSQKTPEVYKRLKQSKSIGKCLLVMGIFKINIKRLFHKSAVYFLIEITISLKTFLMDI